MMKRRNAEGTPRAKRVSQPPRSSDGREMSPCADCPSDTVKREGATHAYGTSGFDARLDELRRLYAAGEMDAALDIARTVTPRVPTGFSLASIPVVALAEAELRELPLDHRAGFVLANVDGRADLETVLDLSAMPLDEVLGVVEHLLALGAIHMLPPRL